MRAVLLNKPTKAEEVVLSKVKKPEVRPGWVLVKIKAFGLNHSEQILRQFEIKNDYIRKPIIPGIECVGEIENPSDTSFEKGQKIIALMGGMGRSFHGSYAEYALLPAHHVFLANSDLPWDQLAAVPETYFTAWGSLFECLDLKPTDKLLVRGGTCALGYVAIQLAKALGCSVVATTHRESKLKLLTEAGVDGAILDDGNISEKLRGSGITKALELVGPKTVIDTMRCLEKGGIACNTGILGNVFVLNNFDPIKDIPNGVYLTGFFSNTPTQKIVDDILGFIKEHKLNPCVGAKYHFSDIKQALIDMDDKKINGKIVVTMD